MNRYVAVTFIGSQGPNVGEGPPETYRNGIAHPSVEQTPTKMPRSSSFEEAIRRRKREVKRPPDEEPNRILENGQKGADTASLSLWYRSELSPELATIRAPRAPFKIGLHQRVLVATNNSHSQARIEIAAGKLAGSQIQLVLAAGRVEAQLLTVNEASRQTLMVALAAMRERLRTRSLLAPSASDGAFNDRGQQFSDANSADAAVRQSSLHKGSAQRLLTPR